LTWETDIVCSSGFRLDNLTFSLDHSSLTSGNPAVVNRSTGQW